MRSRRSRNSSPLSDRAQRLVDLGYTIPFPDTPAPGKVVVSRNPDGSKCIHVSAHDAARLGGRGEFGHVEVIQKRLLDAIADEWYGSDCAPSST